MSDLPMCHLNGIGHSWMSIPETTRGIWCRYCGALGHYRADTGEAEWQTPSMGRKPRGSFLKLKEKS